MLTLCSMIWHHLQRMLYLLILTAARQGDITGQVHHEDKSVWACMDASAFHLASLKGGRWTVKWQMQSPTRQRPKGTA